MELNRITLPPLATPGDVITCYAYEGGAVRSSVLATLAYLLAGRDNATTPVLMIDWDTEAPGLHRLFGAARGDEGGVVELFAACRAALEHAAPGAAGPEAARLALEAAPWREHIVRVDDTRPLYLMRAARTDADAVTRAAGFDWEGLFARCPALFRCFAAELTRHFRYVLVDARGGRSAQATICTTLLPTRVVAMFSPSQRALDGTLGALQRAFDYRRSHEDEQRPLLAYPLPVQVDPLDLERRLAWRDGAPEQPGYQPAWEHLLRDAYGYDQLSLDSFFDEVQLPYTSVPARAPARADRLAPDRGLSALLDWLADGFLPWQSQAEITLQRELRAARAGGDPAAEARTLCALGDCHVQEGQLRAAVLAFEQALLLLQRCAGDAHPATRGARAQLAALLLGQGRLAEARFLYELLLEDGDDLGWQLGLAETLSCQGEHEDALRRHAAIAAGFDAAGADDPAALSALLAQADALARKGELSRARMVYERVLEGRQRLLGPAHEDTLRCMRQLAALLSTLGDFAHARALQESLLALRLRHQGAQAAATARERALLADILAQQGDLGAVQRLAGPARAAPAASFDPDGLHGAVLVAAGRLAGRPQGLQGPITDLHGAPPHPAPALERDVLRLRRQLDSHDLPGARATADSLRQALRQAAMGDPLRRTGSQLIKRTYTLQGDKDALVAFQEEELRAFEGALGEESSAAD
ncbi:MAG: tetratricopeptide repeat protein [Telluria sp.]